MIDREIVLECDDDDVIFGFCNAELAEKVAELQSKINEMESNIATVEETIAFVEG